MLDVAGADGQIKHFSQAHEHALERRTLTCLLERHDGPDDKGCSDLVELTPAQRLHDVALESAALILVAHDLRLLEPAPKTKSVTQAVPARRFEPDLFSEASGFLSCLREIHVWVLAELFVGDTAR